MRLKIMIAVYVVVVLAAGKILLDYFYNESVINAYEEGNYSVNDDMLLAMNVLETYIPYYNNANILYKTGEYVQAEEEYQKAIDEGIPEGKECPVRINMALSVIGQLPNDYKEPKNVEESIKTLKRARDYLTVDDCANDEGTGHSKKAERLKRDIDAEIEELENIQQQQQQNQQDQNQQDQDQQDQDQQDQNQQDQNQQQQQQMQDMDQKTQQQMEQYQQQSQIDRQNDMDTYSRINSYARWNSDYNNIW